MTEALASAPDLLAAHLRLSLLGIAIGTAIAVPAGIIAATRPGMGRVVEVTASAIQTVPGLALLALMVPLLAAVELPSVGMLPAVIGLALYSLLPILRNTVVALTTIDPDIREAARGVGMTERQQLWQVDLPLARPIILAGIRTAAVSTVGMATLATPVGSPSLGNLIFGGLQTRNFSSVVIGCVLAALVAISFDQALARLARWLDRSRPAPTPLRASRWQMIAAGIALIGLTLALLDRRPSLGTRVVIGSKPFTEQYILAEVLAQYLQREVGLEADLRTSLGSTVVYDGLRAGAIDVYVDYTGTLWTTVLGRTTPPPSRATAIADIGRDLMANGVQLVASLGFENAYCLAMRRTEADSLGVNAIGDLAPHMPRLAVGGDYEFFERQEWREIVARYGLSVGRQITMDPALLFSAIASEQINVVSAYTTDPRLASLDLRVLADPLGAIPPYDAVLLTSRAFAESHPEAVAALRRLEGALDAAQMRSLNLAVDQGGQSPARAARTFVARLRSGA